MKKKIENQLEKSEELLKRVEAQIKEAKSTSETVEVKTHKCLKLYLIRSKLREIIRALTVNLTALDAA